MKIFSKKIFILLGLLIMAPITANSATVNLNALTNTNLNPVELNLTAGTYNVIPTAGKFTAWNAWGCNNAASS